MVKCIIFLVFLPILGVLCFFFVSLRPISKLSILHESEVCLLSAIEIELTSCQLCKIQEARYEHIV